jgi:hypothetical protein
MGDDVVAGCTSESRPIDLGLNQDTRRLGVLLHRVRAVHDASQGDHAVTPAPAGGSC